MEPLSVFSRRDSREDLALGAGGSLLVHVLLVAAALILPAFSPRTSVKLPYYSVNLVSPEDLGGAPAAPKSASAQKSPQAPSQAVPRNVPVMPVRRLQVDDAPAPPVEKGVKKLDAPVMPKTSRAPSAPADEISKLIKKPEDAPGEKAPPATSEKTQGKGGTPGPSAKAGGPAGQSGDGEVTLARRLYYTEVWNAIRRQWNLPETLSQQRGLEAVLVVTVRRDGKVLNVQFEKRSGNAMFDESALRAVQKADPLPKFPEIYSPAREEIGIRFRPEDLA